MIIYSAMRSAPDSHLINDYQQLDQLLLLRLFLLNKDDIHFEFTPGVRPVAPPTWLVSNFLVRPASS